MPLPGRRVSAGTLVLNHGATNVAHSQTNQTLLSSEMGPHLQTHERSLNGQNFVIGTDGVRNQERLCWRGPAAIYMTLTLYRLL
jgi:hypothetical protein